MLTRLNDHSVKLRYMAWKLQLIHNKGAFKSILVWTALSYITNSISNLSSGDTFSVVRKLFKIVNPLFKTRRTNVNRFTSLKLTESILTTRRI